MPIKEQILPRIRRSNRIDRMNLIQEMLDFYDIDVSVKFGSIGRFRLYRKSDKRIKKKLRSRILNKGKVRNRIKSVGHETIFAEYVFDSNEIIINPETTKNNKEFVMTILHELKHAEQSKRLGRYNFEKQYFNYTDTLDEAGEDGYQKNPFEIEAESWAESELHKWL